MLANSRRNPFVVAYFTHYFENALWYHHVLQILVLGILSDMFVSNACWTLNKRKWIVNNHQGKLLQSFLYSYVSILLDRQ